jgi:hypothetical protein
MLSLSYIHDRSRKETEKCRITMATDMVALLLNEKEENRERHCLQEVLLDNLCTHSPIYRSLTFVLTVTKLA